jgi:hypothetical protein
VRRVARGPSLHQCTHAALIAVAFVVVVSGAGGADERSRLAGLRQVSVSVDLGHRLDGMTAHTLAEHLFGALRKSQPPLAIQDGLSDRIRFTVSVRSVSATTLRGFWLPFSGTYGIGALRLGVERMVTLSGVPGAFPALVWQTERTVGTAWRESDREIVRLLDEMVAELLEARRSHAGQ